MPSSTLASTGLIHQINFTNLSFFSVSEIADLLRRFNSSILRFQTLGFKKIEESADKTACFR